MITTTFFMMLSTVIACIVLGIIAATIYIFWGLFVGCLKTFISRKNKSLVSDFKSNLLQRSNTFDFAFFSFWGIVYIIVGYVACDGVRVFYPIVAFVTSFVFTLTLLARLIEKRFN